MKGELEWGYTFVMMKEAAMEYHCPASDPASVDRLAVENGS